MTKRYQVNEIIFRNEQFLKLAINKAEKDKSVTEFKVVIPYKKWECVCKSKDGSEDTKIILESMPCANYYEDSIMNPEGMPEYSEAVSRILLGEKSFEEIKRDSENVIEEIRILQETQAKLIGNREEKLKEYQKIKDEYEEQSRKKYYEKSRINKLIKIIKEGLNSKMKELILNVKNSQK